MYLAIPIAAEAFRRAVTELLIAVAGPFVLLTPLSHREEVDSIELLRSRQACHEGLDELLAFGDQRQFIARIPLADAIDQGRSAEALTAPLLTQAPQAVFRNEGDSWTFEFSGKTARTSRSVIGFTYICYLLRCPGVDIHCSQLLSAREGLKQPIRLSSVQGAAGKSIDKFKEEFTSLETELLEAEANNDPGRKEAIQREIDRLTNGFFETSGFAGRNKKEIDDVERVRKSVSNAIDRAIKTIKRIHDELAQHLDNSIQRGQFLAYEPDQKITWVTE